MQDSILAVMIGHAVGDALGVPVEFLSRTELDAKPTTEMAGYGTFRVPEGCWSDDTSMALCALDSLKRGEIDYDEIMTNFGKWYYSDEYTPTGRTFDAGNTCSIAIHSYVMGGDAYSACGQTSEDSNGNGSLMRIHPFVLYAKYMGIAENTQSFHELIRTASALTHAHARSVIGCGIYAYILSAIIDNPCKQSIVDGLTKARKAYNGQRELSYYRRLFDEGFAGTERSAIRSSGYIVDSLEAAVWCLLTTDSYRECVLRAVNLGSDTDTVAAIAGGLAGALYGYAAIPTEWTAKLKRLDYLTQMCDEASKNWR